MQCWTRLRELANQRRRFGYRRLHILLRREGVMINRKKTQRLYREEGPAGQMASGRRFRVLNVVDDVTRECLAAVPDTSISGHRVGRALTEMIERCGKPGMIVSDNGTELTSNAVLAWSQRWAWSGITLPPADRCRTATSRASMAGCATSCSTRHCSRASRMPGSRSLRGWRITTGRDRTHPWATQHRRRSPPIWISNGLLRYALRAPLRSPLLQPRSCAKTRLGSNPNWGKARGHVTPDRLLVQTAHGQYIPLAQADRDKPLTKLLDFYAISNVAMEIMFAPSIHNFLNLIFEEDILVFQSLTFERGLTQAIHQNHLCSA